MTPSAIALILTLAGIMALLFARYTPRRKLETPAVVIGVFFLLVGGHMAWNDNMLYELLKACPTHPRGQTGTYSCTVSVTITVVDGVPTGYAYSMENTR